MSGNSGEANVKHERRLVINARRMTTRGDAHAHLKQRLRLPEWYGNNLDALHDCLSEIGIPTRVILRYAPLLESMPDGYGSRLIAVLEQSAQENANLRLEKRTRF